MPSDILDQRHLSSFYMPSLPSSFFSEEIRFPSERQVGFWKTGSVPDHRGLEAMSFLSRSKAVSSSPLEKLRPVGGNHVDCLELNNVDCLELSQPYFFKDQKTNTNIEHHLMGAESTASRSTTSWKAPGRDFTSLSKLYVQLASLSVEANKAEKNGVHYENVRLSANDVIFGQSVDATKSNFGEDEPFESLEEIEAQMIGNLLPDDDDLLSEVIHDFEYVVRPNRTDDVEDDLFCSGGGMELEAGDNFSCNKASDFVDGGAFNGQEGGLDNPFAAELPCGEQPSRTLFVRNIIGNVEDMELRVLFEQYGDIHTLYTGCKHQGFVMVSYYNIRAAQNAMRALQNKPLRHHKLDIHFFIPKDNPSEKDINHGALVVLNLDSSVSNDDLHQIFGIYGEIKEIRETPHERHHKIIEFYDVRAAEAALCALNGRDIAGKRINLEPCRSGGASSMQQLSSEPEQEESSGCRQENPSNNSPSEDFVSSGFITLGANTSSGLDYGAIQGIQSAFQMPNSSFVETKFHGLSSSVPHSFSSPVRVATVGNHSDQSGHCELIQSLEPMNFGFQSMPTVHPHSLPEFHDGVISGISFNSPSTVSAIAMNMNSRLANGIDNRHIHRVGSGGLSSHSFEQNEAAFRVLGNGICPLHVHQYVWNNSNTYHHHPPSSMIWQSLSPFMNNIPAQPPQQVHGLSRGPSHMLNPSLPLHHHHVGSAPALNPSLWDRRHTYAGDCMEAGTLHPGSLGSMGFSSCSQLHQLELASHNIFPHAGGNCIDPSVPSAYVGIPSPQQMCHMFRGRNTMNPVPVSYDAPHDRIRSRRSDSSANQADNKKQYELDIDRIIRGEDSRTTLMIKNIPNKYTSKMLLATIDEQHKGTYDFIYLPIDFKNKCNVGYAFINMIDPQHIIPFYQAFNGKKWEKFNSEKVASLAYARIQGKEALIAHFQNSSLMNEDKRCRPILFHSYGPNAGDQEPFPVGVNIRSRRSRTAPENHQGSPDSLNGEEPSNATDSSSISIKESE